MPIVAVLALGFVLGLRHATDADHVVAVATLVSRERSPRGALALGALWGVGHTLTILLVGGAIIVFDLVIPPRVGLSMELCVALMLILLGALNLTGAAERLRRASAERAEVRSVSAGLNVTLDFLRRGGRSLVVGVVHGLAGSAAIALLVLGTVKSPAAAVSYLAVFGSGTIAGMMLITATLSVPFRLAAGRFAAVEQTLARATGALSLAFGLFLAYRIGFVDGLFAGAPLWTPE